MKMTLIPIAPVTMDDKGRTIAGTLAFSGYSPTMGGEPVDLKERVQNAAEKFGRGSPFLMIDVKGISGMRADPAVLKKMRSKRMDTWFMTGIVSLDDVFDAFYTGSDGLAVPYHTVRSDMIMSEINRISDHAVPAVFTNGRDAVTFRGHEDLISAVKRLGLFGYGRIGVFDVSGQFSEDMWKRIREETAGVIPYSYKQTHENEKSLQRMGFGHIFTESF